MKTVLHIATWSSFVLLCVTIALMICSIFINPFYHSVSINPNFHVSVRKWELSPRLVFFSHKDEPYFGSIISFGDPYILMDRIKEFDNYGIYYRYFHWQNNDPTIWTLAISLWYPATIFAMLPCIALARRRCLNAANKQSTKQMMFS